MTTLVYRPNTQQVNAKIDVYGNLQTVRMPSSYIHDFTSAVTGIAEGIIPAVPGGASDSLESLTVTAGNTSNPSTSKTHTFMTLSSANRPCYGTLGTPDPVLGTIRKTVVAQSLAAGASYCLTVTSHVDRFGVTGTYTYILSQTGQSIELVWNTAAAAWVVGDKNQSTAQPFTVVVGPDDSVPETWSGGCTQESSTGTLNLVGTDFDPLMVGGFVEWPVTTANPAATFNQASQVVTIATGSFTFRKQMVGGTITWASGSPATSTIVYVASTSEAWVNDSTTRSGIAWTSLVYTPQACYQSLPERVINEETIPAEIASQSGTTITFNSSIVTADLIGSKIYWRGGGSGTQIIKYLSPTTVKTRDSMTRAAQGYSIPYRQRITTFTSNTRVVVNDTVVINNPVTTTIRYQRRLRAVTSKGRCAHNGILVEHLGYGTGITALTTALAQCDAQGGGTVIVKAGTYIGLDAVTMRSNCILRGEGWNTKIVTQGANNPPINVQACDNWCICDLELPNSPWVNDLTNHGGILQNETGAGIFGSGGSNGRITNVHFKNLFGCVGWNSNAKDIMVDHCFLDNCVGGIQFNNCDRIYYMHNKLDYIVDDNLNFSTRCGDGWIAFNYVDNHNLGGGRCCQLDGGEPNDTSDTTCNVERVHVINNTFKNNNAPAFKMMGRVTGCVIANNYVYNCMANPVPTVNLHLDDEVAALVMPDAASGHNTIVGNTFDSCNRAMAIFAQGNTVKGNIQRNCTNKSYIVYGNAVEHFEAVEDDEPTHRNLIRADETCFQAMFDSATPAANAQVDTGLTDPEDWVIGTRAFTTGTENSIIQQTAPEPDSNYGFKLTGIYVGIFAEGASPVPLRLIITAASATGSHGALLDIATINPLGDAPTYNPAGDGLLDVVQNPATFYDLSAYDIILTQRLYKFRFSAPGGGATLKIRVTATSHGDGEATPRSGLNDSGNIGQSGSSIDYKLMGHRAAPIDFFRIGDLGNRVGQVQLGASGTPISQIKCFTIAGNLPNPVPANSEAIVAGVTATGLATTDFCYIANASAVPAGLMFTGAYCNATNQVTFKVMNVTGAADTSAAAYSIKVIAYRL